MREFSMKKICLVASRNNCEEVHITVGSPIAVLLKGKLIRLETPLVTSQDTALLMNQISPDRNRQEVETNGTTEFEWSQDDLRFRIHVFKELGAVRIVAINQSPEIRERV